MEKLKNIFSSKPYNWMLWIAGALIVLATVFIVGVQVGLRKARYSYAWGANYERNFMGPRQGMTGRNFPEGPAGMRPRDFAQGPGRDMRNPHGTVGNIVSITDNTIVVKDSNNQENMITVDDRTIIKNAGNDIKITDLKTTDKIVVMGRPDNNGTVLADFIRVFADYSQATNNNNNNNNQN